jgi:hypothetical protein
MEDVAHISFEGGGLVIPIHTPYERQLLVEHVELSTKRYGSVRLEMNRRNWSVSINDGPGEMCSSCARQADELTYRSNGKSLCRRCARRALH